MFKIKNPVSNFLAVIGSIIILFSSCDRNPSSQFLIQGEFDDYGGEEISLMHQVGNEWEVVDKAILDQEGKFLFSGQLDMPEFVYLVTKENKDFVRFFLENNNINVKVSKGSKLNEAQISGSRLQVKFEEYNRIDKLEYSDSLYAVYKKWNEANAGGDTVLAWELDSIRQVIYNQRIAYNIDFIKDNSDNVLAPFILNLVFQTLDTSQVVLLINTFDPSIDKSIYTKQLKQKIDALRAIEPGKPFINFSLPDSTGKLTKLSELINRGNYLVLDFWATWSGSSLLEIENKKELYSQYYDKGFELVSVSLDNDLNKWKKNIEELRMPWLQLIDVKGPRGETATNYYITGLPIKYIYDPEGNLIARVQSDEELKEELKVIFD